MRFHNGLELNKMASIPLYVTMKPGNLPKLIPNAHLRAVADPETPKWGGGVGGGGIH